MTSTATKSNPNGQSPNGHSPNGNGQHKDIPVITDLWDTLPPSVIEKLEQPLDPGLVSQRRGRANRTYSYIEGHTAIDQANRIFGRGGWGYDVIGEVTLRDVENTDSKTGEVKTVRAYCATVRVSVTGALPRTDVGFHAVAEENAEGHDTACKGAVTDGLKRALRSFGDQFGNSLNGEGSPASDTLTPSLRQTLLELGMIQGFDEEKVRAAVKSKTGKELDELPASEVGTLLEATVKRMQQSADGKGEEKQGE